jgi:hypothetical protein
MKPNDYLKKILEQQTFGDDEQELKDLRQRRINVEKALRKHFTNANPSIRWAGSMAKGTMIRESYDGDMTCYFGHDENAAGSTLEEIYDNAVAALSVDFQVERKASAIRVRDKKEWSNDLHVDVVPGRFTDDKDADVFLHRTTGDKQRLKTNLQVHIDHIKESGVTDAIRLLKLWKVRNGLDAAKTFVLELLVVKLLDQNASDELDSQLIRVWTEFRDHAERLTVEDPANPTGNDLKDLLDECRHLLSTAAANTLWQVENKGWEAVFGELEEDDGNEDTNNQKDEGRDRRQEALKAAVASVAIPTKPWLQNK